MLTGRGELALDTNEKIFDGLTEAEFFAKSIKDVAGHYGSGMFDQKTLDWMNLIQCCAIVYGGRIYAIRSNPRVKAAPAPRGPQGVRPGPAPSVQQPHATMPPVNEMNGRPTPAPEDFRKGEIPGIGEIIFPDDHPLVQRKDN